MLTIGFIDTLVRAYDLEPSYSFVASSTDRLCLDSQTDQQMRFFSSNIYLIPKLVCSVKLIREGLKQISTDIYIQNIFHISMQQCSMRRPDQAPRSSFPIFHIYLSKLEHKAKYYLQYISKYFIFISTPPPFCTSAVSTPPPGCPTIVEWRQTQAGNCYKYNNGHVSRVMCHVSRVLPLPRVGG